MWFMLGELGLVGATGLNRKCVAGSLSFIYWVAAAWVICRCSDSLDPSLAMLLLGMAQALPASPPSERHLRLALEAANMVTWEYNFATGQISYTGNVARIAGGNQTAPYRHLKTLLPLVHPDDLENLTRALNRAASGSPLELDYRIKQLNGRYRWIRLHGRRQGPGRTIHGVSLDIHEHKILEQQRTVFAALGKNLSATSTPEQAGLLILDAASDMLGWDAAYLDLYSPQDNRVVPLLAFDLLDGKRKQLPLSPKPVKPGRLTRSVLENGPRLLQRNRQTERLGRFGDVTRPSESVLLVPVRLDDVAVGVLSIQSYTPGAYQRDDLKLLQNLADYCAGALERIKIAEALRESERKLRLIAQNTTDVVFAFDMDRRIVYANPTVKDLTGYTYKEIRRRGFINWVHPEDQPRMLKLWDLLFQGQGYSDVEFRLVTKQGKIKWCSSSWGPLYDESHRQIGVQGQERDITERHLLESALIENSAREQRRIGHSLHDGLGQVLTGLSLKATTLEQMLSGSPEAAELARRIVELASYTMRQARNLAYGLDPVHLADDGLPSAMHALALQSSDFLQVQCTSVATLPALRLKPDVAVSLYRIAQEAIHNAARRGHAKNVTIRLFLDGPNLCLAIDDDGRGFTHKPAAQPGMGLRIMRARAASLGGTLTIQRRAAGGTTVLCRVPRSGCRDHSRAAAHLPVSPSGDSPDSHAAQTTLTPP